MATLDEVYRLVREMHKKLIIAEPEHFSKRDLVDAFFGSLFLGITFTIKGLLIQVSKTLGLANLISIVAFTLLILTAEIYFIGYSRVREKSRRRFGQFWLKRIVAFYFVAVFTATFLVFIFGLNNLPDVANAPFEITRLIVLISMPCAIGAAITDLLKKY